MRPCQHSSSLEQCHTILSLNSIRVTENTTTTQRTKSNSPHVKKTIDTTNTSPVTSRHSTYVRREALLFMFDRILHVTLFNNFSELEDALRRSFEELVLGILYSPSIFILLIYTMSARNTRRWTHGLTPRPHLL